jgi:hypothetical protein
MHSQLKLKIFDKFRRRFWMPSGLICRLSSRSGAFSSQRLVCYPQHGLLHKSRLAGLDATFTRNSDVIGAHPEARHINGPPKPSSNDSRTSPLALSVRAARTPRTGKVFREFFHFSIIRPETVLAEPVSTHGDSPKFTVMASIMKNANRLQKALETNSGTSFGAWQMLPGGNLSRVIVRAGFEWVCVDCEHGNIAGNVPATTVTSTRLISNPLRQSDARISGSHRILRRFTHCAHSRQ